MGVTWVGGGATWSWGLNTKPPAEAAKRSAEWFPPEPRAASTGAFRRPDSGPVETFELSGAQPTGSSRRLKTCGPPRQSGDWRSQVLHEQVLLQALLLGQHQRELLGHRVFIDAGVFAQG